MPTWDQLSSKLRWVMIVGAILVTLAVGATILPFLLRGGHSIEDGAAVDLLTGPKTSLRSDIRTQWKQTLREHETQLARADEETRRRRSAISQDVPTPEVSLRRVLRVRRYDWQAPATRPGTLQSVYEDEISQVTLEAFLRVCVAEAEGHLPDCIGIWQVANNLRRPLCDRSRVRHITECVEDEKGERSETLLSALRRAQPHVLGQVPPRNRRVRWIGKLTTECEPPEGWPESWDVWNAQYAQRCQKVVALGRYLLKGELPPSLPGSRYVWLPGAPITWGGRCEYRGGTCDDHQACARGLARIPTTDTLNAFWCLPGPGCSRHIDPICLRLGYPSRRTLASTADSMPVQLPVKTHRVENS